MGYLIYDDPVPENISSESVTAPVALIINQRHRDSPVRSSMIMPIAQNRHTIPIDLHEFLALGGPGFDISMVFNF
jgi:hypothetical protein